LLGFGIRHTILFTNKLVMLTERIPYAYVNGLQISILQSIMLYLLLLACVFYFMFRAQWLFKLSLAALLLFIVLWGTTDIKQQTQQKLVIYSISNNNAVHLINGKTSLLMIDSSLLYDKQKFKFHMQQHIWQCGIRQTDTVLNNNAWKLIQAGTKQVLLSGTNMIHFKGPVHLLVVRHKLDMTLIGELNPAAVVITGTVKKKWAAAIERYCREKNIPVHHVLYSGAYQLIL
jgi:competence protein ComEC